LSTVDRLLRKCQSGSDRCQKKSPKAQYFSTATLHAKSILIIKPGPLGGIIHTLPAVALVREAHPDAEITWLINPELAPLLRGNPDVDHVYFVPHGEFRGLGAPTSLFTWLKKTRKIRPDLALDFQELPGSALIAKISGAKEICGMSSGLTGASWFYDRVARVDRRDHVVERYLKLAECVGATVGDSLRCQVPSGDPLPRFDAHPPFVLLHPFARGQDKSLSNAVIEEFCLSLAPTRVVVIGQSHCRINTPENCVDLTRQTSLLQLIWLIRVARFVVSVESGPMNIAAAVTPNLLSIHTWTDPGRIGPYNPDAWVWKHGQLFRVGELETAKIRKRGRRFKRKDVASVVELIRPRVPIDPMVA
jgi:heptosyltransferase I